MRVVVPAAPGMLHPAVVPALAGYAPQVRWLRDDFAYGRLLAELWPAPGDICVVEHDVEVNPGTLASFEACPHPWCSAPYRVRTLVVDGFGCCRFREELRCMIPAPSGPMHWTRAYTAYVMALHPLGLAPHRRSGKLRDACCVCPAGLAGHWGDEDPRSGLEAEKAFKQKRDQAVAPTTEPAQSGDEEE